ncbi:MAG: hypothetical protein ACM31P_18740 [Actinomycetota bacterium]
MKLSKLPVALLLVGMAVAAASPAWAHGGSRHHGSRVGVGISIGAPLWPWYDPFYRPYYPPAVVAVPVAPPPPVVYIEQQAEIPPPQSYWYYCNSSRTYYPYVQQCPEGWQKVMPRPPS